MSLPKVTAVLNFYENKNQPYLDLALKSLLRQEGVDLEVILVSSAITPPTIPEGVILLNEKRENGGSKNVEIGIRAARKESEFIFTTSDDVIHSQCSLRNLAVMAQNRILVNSVSNCDNTILYQGTFFVPNKKGDQMLELRPLMRLEQIAGFEDAIMDFPFLLQYPFLFRVPYLNIFACMFKKEIFEEVGTFDYENLIVCGEDTDWCIRAEQKGIYSYVCLNAFALHFGGVTSSESHRGEKIKQGIVAFEKKWGIDVTKIIPQHMGSYTEHIELVALRKEVGFLRSQAQIMNA